MLCTRRIVAAAVAVWAGSSVAWAGLTEYQDAVRAEPSLISYFTFDADTGTTVADTFTTTAPNPTGTFAGTGGVSFAGAADAFGAAGQALSLTGTGWVDFGAVSEFAFGGQSAEMATAGTVEMWIRPSWVAGVPTYNPTMASMRDVAANPSDPNPDTRWSFHLQSTRLGCGVFGGIMGYHPGNWDFTADQWYHVAFVFSPNYNGNTNYPTTRVFVNGILLNDFWGFLGAKTTASFQIGAATPAGSGAFIGLIDEVAIYSSQLSDSLISQHYLAGAGIAPTAALPSRAGYAAAVMADAPIGYYSFEGDDTAVTDNSGHGHNGTLTAPTYWTSGFAGGQALGFDSSGRSGGRVDMGPVEEFKLAGGTGTLEAWIAPAGGLKYRSNNFGWPFNLDWAFDKWRPTILSSADNFSSLFHYGLEMRISDQSLALETYNNSYDSTATAFPGGWATAEKWYHVAAVFGDGNVTYYVNGAQAGTTKALDPTVPAGDFTGMFQLGCGDPTGDWGFPGKIDEVAIYNTALSAERIAAHYATVGMRFDIHNYEFVDPTNFAPLDLTLMAPTGQTSPAGLVLTFTYDASVITLKSALPAPYDVEIPSGVPITVPVAGLTSVPLQVIPIPGGYGMTILSVTPDPSSGWLVGDSVQIVSKLAIQGNIIVNDHFDDGGIGTNSNGPGGGWYVPYAAKGQPAEEGSSVKILPNAGWYAWTGITGKPAGEFPFMNPDGIRIEWVINYVQLTAAGGGTESGWPNAAEAECSHELGVISANSANDAWNELYRNTLGGFYVNLYYSGYNGSPTEDITVKGNVRVVNVNHAVGSGDGANGIETPVVFELTNVHSITPEKPLVVTIELDATGWKVGFSQDAAPVYSVFPSDVVRPGLVIDTSTDKVTGGWGTDTLGEGMGGAAITNEFNNGAFLFAAFHNIVDGNGQGWIDRVKACIGCSLVTDCPNPFADGNYDTFVDQKDFGLFQACWTGTIGGIPDGCRCFDHNSNGAIDLGDFEVFLQCAALSGPTIVVPKTCDD